MKGKFRFSLFCFVGGGLASFVEILLLSVF